MEMGESLWNGELVQLYSGWQSKPQVDHFAVLELLSCQLGGTVWPASPRREQIEVTVYQSTFTRLESFSVALYTRNLSLVGTIVP
jgi:hypothetical protein